MLASDAFAKFQEGGLGAVTTQDAEAFFRIDDYVVSKAREQKVIRALNAFGGDAELGPVVKALADTLRKGEAK